MPGARERIAERFQIGVGNLAEHFVGLVAEMREELADDLLVLEQRALGNFLALFVFYPLVERRARGDVVKRFAGCLLVNLADNLATLRFDQPPGASGFADRFPLRRHFFGEFFNSMDRFFFLY